MPWAGDRLAVPVALGQRTIIVGAGAADGKDLLAQADKDYSNIADVASEDLSVFELLNGDALRQVGSQSLVGFRTHGLFLSSAAWRLNVSIGRPRSGKVPDLSRTQAHGPTSPLWARIYGFPLLAAWWPVPITSDSVRSEAIRASSSPTGSG